MSTTPTIDSTSNCMYISSECPPRVACRMSTGLTLSLVENDSSMYFFFFQAEDGIRDLTVTGVQTCALPISPVVILATDLIVGSAPVERAGAASAISETSSELGGALGIAVLGSIGVAVYRGMMATGIPIGVPPEAAEVARATLGGALSVAQQLPHDLRVELLDTARDAFAQSVRLTAAISAAISLTMAIIVGVLLRQRTSS